MKSKFSDTSLGQISDIAQPAKCRQCGSKIWRLIVSGIERSLDAKLLSLRDEILIRAENLTDPWFGTYAIRRSGQTFIANYRRQVDILAGKQELVLADHVHTALATAELPTYFPARHSYEIPERPAF